MNDIFIYTELNAPKVGNITIPTFHEHHDRKLHIIAFKKDFDELEPHPNNVLINVSDYPELAKIFKQGADGVSLTYAMVLLKMFGNSGKIIHFDTDVLFRKDCIKTIEYAFDKGYDLIGSRRTYGNNPGGIKGLEGLADVISTYFFGINVEKLPIFDIGTLTRMVRGAHNPLGHRILDMFDPVSFVMLNAGAKIGFFDQNQFGGQNEDGKKDSKYKSNLHMDFGDFCVHFGGLGAGYSRHMNEGFNDNYGLWALGRYSMFCKYYYNEDIGHDLETIYGDDGRWIAGNYDDNVYNQFVEDLKK